MSNTESLSMEPTANKLRREYDKEVVTINQKFDSFQKTVDKTEQNSAAILVLQNDVLAKGEGGSPNTAANPQLLDRYALQPSDVLKMLQQSREQKAQGQAYAGKYSLTPQNFYTTSDGILKPAPYGIPPTDGKATKSPNDYQVPIITDACYQLFDPKTGIHYRWDQFQENSQKFIGVHWNLDGPRLSVSLDGLQWVSIRTLLYDNSGSTARVCFWLDRDNRIGYGNNTFIVADQHTTYVLPNLTASNGVALPIALNTAYQDCRLYWDASLNSFLVLGCSSSNNYLIIRTGNSINNIHDAFTYNDPIFFGSRLECPSWLSMFDQVTGDLTKVITVSIQGSPFVHTESFCIGTCRYSASEMSMIQKFRIIEYGRWAYAQMLCDPLQQDGTGGTRVGCDRAVMNVGCYNWGPINGGTSTPAFGFAGGSFIPADVILKNGIPYCLPNSKFKAAMTGRVFEQSGIAQGINPSNPNWVLNIAERKDVWLCELYIKYFQVPVGTTIRFHFGSRYVDYIFQSGIIDILNANSGTTVIMQNNNGGINDNSTRRMPMTDSFVTATDNTLVWEYDYGRIRLYNTNTGTYMSEVIYPDGFQLSAIEIIGPDFFQGGFQLKLTQDGGLNY